VLAAAEFPTGLKNTFNNMERAGNPFGIAADERLAWAKGLPFPIATIAEKAEPEVLYWVGCAVAFDPRAQKIARSMAELFNAAGIDWAVVGSEEKCTGDPARRLGNDLAFTQVAEANIETIQSAGVKKMVSICPHCVRTISTDWCEAGATFQIEHHSELLARLPAPPSAGPAPPRERVVFHDPCYLGRYRDKYDEPREVIERTADIMEPRRTRERSFCCGAGGGQMFLGEEKGKRVNVERVEELVATGAPVIGTACPFCQTMFRDALGAVTKTPPKLLDIAQIAAANLPPEPAESAPVQ
jgi:Fe-S oxidoreductase